MIVVRRTLTELLLEVTNEEIAKVADESLKSFKSKGTYLLIYTKNKTYNFIHSRLRVSVSLVYHLISNLRHSFFV